MRLRFADQVMARLGELASRRADAGRLTRLDLTALHAAAAAAVRGWMIDAGMSGVAIDAIGNVVGRHGGASAS